MKKVEDYRRHAEECRQMARRFRSDAEREMMLNMAKTWESLAANRAALLARKERMKEIESAGAGKSIPSP